MCDGPSLLVVLERDNAASCFHLVLKRSAIYNNRRHDHSASLGMAECVVIFKLGFFELFFICFLPSLSSVS